MRTCRISFVLLTATSAVLASLSAHAQQDVAYPTRPIRMIVGFAAGGGNDILARLVGQKMAEGLGQSLLIENRTGANGEIAADYVRNAAPDGYTLLVGASGMMSVSPVVNPKLPYVPTRDFTPLGMIASFPLVIIVNPATSIRSLRLRSGLSQRQLALRMSVPRTYVSKIENEKATPTLSSLERLARALEVTVPELLSGGEKSRQDEISELVKDQFIAEILPFVSQLNGMQMSSVLTQLRDLTVRPRRTA